MSLRLPLSFRRSRRESAPRRAGRARAFSLVEVVMALGILSFSLVTTLGLMSVGLSTARDSMDATTASLIVQTIGNQARFTAFTNLDAQFAGKTFYFDEEGTFLTNSPASAPPGTRYWVTTALADAAFPGSTNATSASPLANSLRALSIQEVAVSPTAPPKAAARLNLLISNSGG